MDNDVALVGGREVFGFPKHLAELAWEGSHQAPTFRQVTTNVLPVFGSNERVVPQPLVTVRGEPDAQGRRVDGWPELVGQFGAVLKTFGASLPEVLADAVATRGMRQVFLRQTPHAAARSRAAYRTLVESVITIDGLPTGGPIATRGGPYVMELRRFASHDLVHRLGLQTMEEPRGNVARVAVVSQGWMKFSGTVLPAESEIEAAT